MKPVWTFDDGIFFREKFTEKEYFIFRYNYKNDSKYSFLLDNEKENTITMLSVERDTLIKILRDIMKMEAYKEYVQTAPLTNIK